MSDSGALPNPDDTQPILVAAVKSSEKPASPPPESDSRVVPSSARLERSVRALWAVTLMVGLLALVSLAVNAVLVIRLLALRSQVSGALATASRSLDNLAWQGVVFDFPISQTVNFEGDVPFKQDLTFPVKTDFPIHTTVSVPLDLGPLGTQVINVPVNTTVPVDVAVPVHVEQTFHVKTQVPVRMTVPVRISPNDPPLKDWIAQARAWLQSLRKYF